MQHSWSDILGPLRLLTQNFSEIARAKHGPTTSVQMTSPVQNIRQGRIFLRIAPNFRQRKIDIIDLSTLLQPPVILHVFG
jgi:predicted RNase H-like nuclease